jgi:hypothetical protein
MSAENTQNAAASEGCAVPDGYGKALEDLAQMSRDEGMLAVQGGLEKDALTRLTHKQNEVALAYAHARLKRQNNQAEQHHE